MCSPASFVLTEANVYWSRYSDSHSDIISEYNLKETFASRPTLLRVEVTPRDGDLFSDPDTWRFCYDQDMLPSWVSDRDEGRTRKALKDWCNRKLITGRVTSLRDGHYYLSDTAHVEYVRHDASVLFLGGTAHIENLHGRVESMTHKATINFMVGESYIHDMCGSATVNYMVGSAHINYLMSRATVRSMSENAHISCAAGNTRILSMTGNSRIDSLYGSARVEKAGGNSIVQKRMRVGHPVVKLERGSKAVLIDRRYDTVKVRAASA